VIGGLEPVRLVRIRTRHSDVGVFIFTREPPLPGLKSKRLLRSKSAAARRSGSGRNFFFGGFLDRAVAAQALRLIERPVAALDHPVGRFPHAELRHADRDG
jgi:hypothetical protein